jgi:hypothetical protein
LEFVFPEALEAMRSRFARCALIRLRFQQIDAEVAEVPHCLMFNFDEIMVTADLHCKTVATCEPTVFRRKTQKTRNVTLGP